MLSILLLLASGPQTAMTPIPEDPLHPRPQALMRQFSTIQPNCDEQRLRRAQDQGGSAVWRNDGPPVAHYLLLDRYSRGCPDPIIVNYAVPGSNAIGRELGRTPQPLPRYTPPSVRAD
ncbi:hypothetical protein [Brevundimonas sp.]